MRRAATALILVIAVAGCGVDLYESPDFGAVDVGDDVALWRLARGPEGFVGIGGPVQPEDLEEGAGPLTFGSYRSTDGRTWQAGETLGAIDVPLLGLTAWPGGYAASGQWDGVAAVMVSEDGLAWRRIDLPAPGPDAPSIESAGIAAGDGVILVTGFSGEPATPVIWTVDPAAGPTPADTSAFPTGSRLTQAAFGPAGFVAVAVGTTDSSTPPPIWVGGDGTDWVPVLDPFDGATVVTGLIGSSGGYVAVVAQDGSDDRFTVWTSPNGIDWSRRADQDTIFGYLTGKGGGLLADLSGEPGGEPDPRPIAFTFDGRWLEITEAVGGERFVAVAVAADETIRLVSGFVSGKPAVPAILIAGG
ncbi:MAG: hypothetical protein ABIJ75_10100 [Actinomycetota bacterium]